MLAGQNMTETEIWTKWESQVVNGVFPLRRFLGRSNHSVVFLTECRQQNLPNAAIKIIPEDPAQAETQLARWRAAAELSHPHVMRLLDAGRCKLGGHPFLFVVSEYAEQNLAQILPHRGLTSDEARELLAPTLDALDYLHGKGLVHGQLQPPNLLVVDDQLKLSSDGIRPRGQPYASVTKPSPYDAPEAENGAMGFAGDVWSLGATLMEALTQIPPGPHDDAGARLPSSLPMGFVEFVRRCLSNDPARRPTVQDLKEQLNPPPVAHAPAIEIPPVIAEPEVPAQPRPRARPPLPPWLVPAIAGFVVFMALWLGIRALHSRAAAPAPAAVPPTSAKPPATFPQTPMASAPTSAVLHEETPIVSRSARESIRGQIKIVVRVTVDRSGNVTGANTEVRGSSRYFAGLAADAARKWKFAPADNASSREWLIQFDFARDGISARAAQRGKQ
jgi:TonB family protein